MAGEVRTFTSAYKGIATVLKSRVTVGLAFDPNKTSTVPTQHEFWAIWDTGASGSAVSQRVIQKVGLQPTGIARVQTANGIHNCNTYLISIRLPNKIGFYSVKVTEGNLGNEDILIGMDLIVEGDFAITNYQGKTVLTYRTPSIAKIDFVEEAKKADALLKKKVGRNDPCPCGSGKKYKKCHGANE